MKKASSWHSLIVVPAVFVSVWMTSRGETSIPAASTRPPGSPGSALLATEVVDPGHRFRRAGDRGPKARLQGQRRHRPVPRGGRHAYKKGDVLMELDNREQLAAIAVAEAEWRLAQSERERS